LKAIVKEHDVLGATGPVQVFCAIEYGAVGFGLLETDVEVEVDVAVDVDEAVDVEVDVEVAVAVDVEVDVTDPDGNMTTEAVWSGGVSVITGWVAGADPMLVSVTTVELPALSPCELKFPPLATAIWRLAS
jgi:hypothetical protein